MSRLTELAEGLTTAITRRKQQYDAFQAAKALEDEYRLQIQELLTEEGLKQIKTQTATISLTDKPSIVINNEALIIDWLKHTPNVEADAYIGLKATPFKSLATQVLKETGEIIPGSDVQHVETLSVRSVKK